MTADGKAADRIISRRFVALLGVVFLGFAQYHILQAVLPVLIIARGGDAAIAGFVVATHSIPSVLFRPAIGSTIDRIGARVVMPFASSAVALAGLGYLLPGIPLLFATRFVHGAAWSAYSAVNHASLVLLAPIRRRVEAAGIFNLMPGIAQTAMPATAFALIAVLGIESGVVLAVACGVLAMFAGFALSRWMPKRRPDEPASRGEEVATAVETSGVRGRLGHFMVERAVLRPMLMEVAYSSIQPLFLAFAPVYALSMGIPLELMPIYFLTYGGVLVLTRLILGRRADHFRRISLIRAGVTMSLTGLIVVTIVGGFGGLVAGGACFAIATTFESPATMALTMDLAPPGRIGAAMATYSLGFPLATGGSAAIWGIVITGAGFPTPFVLGAGLHFILLVILLLFGSRLTRVPKRREAPGR